MNNFWQNNKQTVIWSVVAIIVIAAAIVSYQKRDSISMYFNGENDNNYEVIDGTTMNPTPTPTEEVQGSPSGTASGLSYEEAIKKYKNRIQFSGCHGTPGSISVAAGSAVMLDNRDKKSHTIKVGSSISVTVKSLGYTIIYPKNKGEQNVTCDGGGAAEIIVN